tara:strand:- start:4703 stop:4846 length:144 start_codon:yes stop_codon:yes gene_type:complete
MLKEEEFVTNIVKSGAVFLFMLLIGTLLEPETAVILLLSLIYIKIGN